MKNKNNEDLKTKFFITNKVSEIVLTESLGKMLKDAGVVVINLRANMLPKGIKIMLEYFPINREFSMKEELIAKIRSYLKENFNLEDELMIEVWKTKNPVLEPAVIAAFIEEALKTNKPIRKILYNYLYRAKQNGAIGGEIYIKGKLGARGAKAKKIKAYFGFIPKAGDLRKYVKAIKYQAVTKAGVVGVGVMITPPEVEPYLKPNQKVKDEVKIEPEEE